MIIISVLFEISVHVDIALTTTAEHVFIVERYVRPYGPAGPGLAKFVTIHLRFQEHFQKKLMMNPISRLTILRLFLKHFEDQAIFNTAEGPFTSLNYCLYK